MRCPGERMNLFSVVKANSCDGCTPEQNKRRVGKAINMVKIYDPNATAYYSCYCRRCVTRMLSMLKRPPNAD
jgi:hypothetical protein